MLHKLKKVTRKKEYQFSSAAGNWQPQVLEISRLCAENMQVMLSGVQCTMFCTFNYSGIEEQFSIILLRAVAVQMCWAMAFKSQMWGRGVRR